MATRALEARGEDVLGVSRAAYAAVASEPKWLEGLAEAATAAFDDGLGLMAWTMRAPLWLPESVTATGAARALVEPFLETVRTLGDSIGVENVGQLVLRSSPFETSTASSHRTMGMDLYEQPGFDASYAAGVRDFMFLRGACPSGLGIVVGAPLRRRMVPTSRATRAWAKAAAHITAGFRLRQQNRTLDGADAVLSPQGQLLNATHEGAVGAREALRAACVAAERARSGPPDNAASLSDAWTALTSGRYSLVDHFDTDGKRYILAVRNDPTLPCPGALSTRETQVAAFIAMGHPLKVVAYELGLSISTVARASASALRKLGWDTRAELAARLQDFLPRSAQLPVRSVR